MVQMYLSSQQRSVFATGTDFTAATRKLVVNTLEPINQIVWPFNSTDWKDFNVKLISVQGNGTLTIRRRVNGVNAGVAVTFTNADPAGTEKTDTTTVALVKGDRIAISYSDNDISGVDPTFSTNSYLEFADGSWGF